MSVFAPVTDGNERVRTFRQPASAPGPAQRGLERLLLAASEAERAERDLHDWKERYQRSPSPAILERVLKQAAVTLEKEIAFDEIWEELSGTLCAGPGPGPGPGPGNDDDGRSSS